MYYHDYLSDEERNFWKSIDKILNECGNDLEKLHAMSKEHDCIDKTIKDGETFYRVVLDKRFSPRLLLNFLELGSDPCYLAPNGETVLHNIFRYRHDIKLIKKVLEKGAKLNHKNEDGKTAPECLSCLETLKSEEASYRGVPKQFQKERIS